uniref:Putative secreted protein n=1 Tax=Anopheles marajoara TaxID=58244 RepID=A0A2M4CCU5_9DIPT
MAACMAVVAVLVVGSEVSSEIVAPRSTVAVLTSTGLRVTTEQPLQLRSLPCTLMAVVVWLVSLRRSADWGQVLLV